MYQSIFKVGDVLKLSKEGLDWIYPKDNCFKERAKLWRWEYMSRSKKFPESLRVKRYTKKGWRRESYHYTFLEKLES